MNGKREFWRPVEAVVQECDDCALIIGGLAPVAHDPYAVVWVRVASNSQSGWHGRWRNRVRNAWAVLRNRYDWSGFELGTPEEAEQFLAKLRSVYSAVGWGELEPGAGER